MQAALQRFLGEHRDDDVAAMAEAARTDGPRSTAASWADCEGDGFGSDGFVYVAPLLDGPATAAPSTPRAAEPSFRPLAELRMLADLEEQAGQISALRTSLHQTHLAAAALVAAAALGTAVALVAPHVCSSLAAPHMLMPLWAWAATAVAALLGALGCTWLALRRPLELKLLLRAVRISWLFVAVLGRYKLARIRSRRLEAKVAEAARSETCSGAAQAALDHLWESTNEKAGLLLYGSLRR